MDGKKVVVQLDLHDDKGKQKAMKAVSSLPGIESISVDMNAKKITVIGNVDPVDIISKLRKCGHAVIVTVGPAKDPKEEEKKKKEAEEKKKKEEAEKKKKAAEEEEKKRIEALAEASKSCPYRYPTSYPYNPYPPQYYCVKSCEENPNSCVIL